MMKPKAPAPGVTIVGNPGPLKPGDGAPQAEDDEDSFWDKLLGDQPAPLKPGVKK